MNDDSNDFGLSEIVETIVTESDTTSLESESVDAGQPETDLGETDKNPELSLDEIAKGLEEKKEGAPEAQQGLDLLAKINAMGLKRGEEAIQLKDEKEIADYIQKGFDYTKKQMERAEADRVKDEQYAIREKEFLERTARTEQEFATIKNEQTILESALLNLQKNPTEENQYLLSEITRIYNESAQEFEKHKPFQSEIETKFKSLHDEIASLKGQKVQEELGAVKQGWEKELSSVQAKLAPMLTKLKISNVAWDKVQKVWEADATNKMTAEEAFDAVHGKDVRAAFLSHQKVLEAKAKKQEKFLSRTGASGASRGLQGEKTQSRDIGEFLMAELA